MTISLRAIRPRRFRTIDPGRSEQNVRSGIRQYLNEVKQELQKNYESVPASPSYKRSRKLFRGWVVTVRSHNFGTLTNKERYAVYVQGPRGGGRTTGTRQARALRRKGWESISDIARRTRKRYTQIMNRSLKGGIVF